MPNGCAPIRVIRHGHPRLLAGKSCSVSYLEPTVGSVSTVTEPETLQQPIADCADIPHSLDPHPAIVLPRVAPHWEVDEQCRAQVADLDSYI